MTSTAPLSVRGGWKPCSDLDGIGGSKGLAKLDNWQTLCGGDIRASYLSGS